LTLISWSYTTILSISSLSSLPLHTNYILTGNRINAYEGEELAD